MEREYEDQTPAAACPRCTDAGWTDAGQARTLVHFRRSRSLETGLDVATVDDTDDRQETYYELLDLIDVGPEHWNGAKLIESLPFGYELLKNLGLREVNFGMSGRAHRNGFKVSGNSVSEKGFDVCLECGRVRGEDDKIRHGAQCKARRTGVKEKTRSLFLYRQVRSEAIRILLPVSEIQLDEKRASFKAALQLGFRRHFQGDPGHLLIKATREPIRGGHRGSRQYIVIYDGVPGGTGYLSELAQEDNFFSVLEQALEALTTCVCQTTTDRDGCYRCLYAYQSQRELPLVSSKEAQSILRAILDKRDQLKTVQTLSQASLDDKLESELELRFLHALRERAAEERDWGWGEQVKGGELRWLLRIGEELWEIRAQVDLGAADGVYPQCRPDFVIRPASGDPKVRPVAVFCDGFAYHVQPEEERSRLADDITKRRGVLASGRYCVWSVTWKDVESFAAARSAKDAPTLFGELNPGTLGRAATGTGLTLHRKLGQAGSMDMLVGYLTEPTRDQWTRLARTFAVAWLSESTHLSPSAGVAVLERLRRESAWFVPGPQPAPDATADVLTGWAAREWMAAAGQCPHEALRQGHVQQLELVLRLFDEWAARQDTRFEIDWRAFLQAWNLMQFHERVEIVSSEGIAVGYPPASEPAVPKVADTEAEPLQDREDIAELMELATEQGRRIIAAVVDGGLPLPTLGYELQVGGRGTGPEPDLAWPELQLAILAERQRNDAKAFVDAGWAVLSYPVDTSAVVEELRRRI
jgi:DEAD/DEAH box helicase domain-containing protein